MGPVFLKQKIMPLPGGWRKNTFLIEGKEKKVACFIPKNSISKNKLLWAARLEEKFGGRKLLNIQEAGNFWLTTFHYLPGEVKWHLDEKDSSKIGQLSASLHKQNLCHFDLKPGNILWKDGKILGVIDFEEAKVGARWIDEDLANTLSWILISGGGKKEFFAGYQKEGRKPDFEKINFYLPKFLKMRAKDGSSQAFLLLAKKKLEEGRKKVQARLLGIEDLTSFRQKNKDKKIIFLVGAFELLHWGHLDFLKRAKNTGDLLVVGVGSDASRKRLKGESFPIVGEKTRAETLAFFDFVDGVVIVEEDNVLEPLQKLKPDVFYCSQKDWDDGVRKKTEADLIESFLGKIIKTSYSSPSIPSSKMVEEVALMKIKSVLFGEVKRQPLLKLDKEKKITKEVKFKDLKKLGKELHCQKKTIVFTSGSADLFHLGHARFIQKAKSLGDVLVVGVPSNKSVTVTKGSGRPIVDQTARALVLAELESVDKVVIFDERTILTCLQRLRPDIFFTVKEDWNRGITRSAEAQFIKSIGGKIVMSERQAPYLSASKMIDKTAGQLIQTKFFDLLKTAKETPVLNADFDPYAPEAQLTARERGFYEKVLEEVAKVGKCVFCDLKEKYLIEEKDGIVLTVALYPYIDGHLLIIPKRHLESIAELTKQEWETVLDLASKGTKILKENLGVINCWFLLREGRGIQAGKTVEHLHFHLLPYDPRVIKMGETKLTIAPLDLAKKLRSAS